MSCYSIPNCSKLSRSSTLIIVLENNSELIEADFPYQLQFHYDEYGFPDCPISNFCLKRAAKKNQPPLKFQRYDTKLIDFDCIVTVGFLQSPRSVHICFVSPMFKFISFLSVCLRMNEIVLLHLIES